MPVWGGCAEVFHWKVTAHSLELVAATALGLLVRRVVFGLQIQLTLNFNTAVRALT